MVKTNGPRWANISIEIGKVGVAGGYNKHHLATETRKCKINTDEFRFLKVAAKEPWLIAGASGSRQIPNGLSARTSLFDDLKNALVRACDGQPTSATTVLRQGTDQANGTGQANADEMDDLSCDDEPTGTDDIPGTRAQRAKRSRYFRNHCKGKVLEIQMPEKAPDKQHNCTTTIPVRLYCEDRKTVWLCTTEAQWAMEYLRDQLEAKGDCAVANDDCGPGGPPPPPDDQLSIGDFFGNELRRNIINESVVTDN